MRLTAPVSVALTVCLTGAGLHALGQQQQPSGPSPRTISTAAPEASVLQRLSGVWDYNAELSVDAATGRPEQAPRSAAARQVAPPANTQAVRPPATGGGGGTNSGGSNSGGASGSGGSGGSGGGGNFGGGVGSTFDDARRAMAILLAAERRTLLRDLLEVNEKLTLRADPDKVTITDDLKRERVYATDGRKRKYQLSAAVYEATGSWQDSAFRKVIHGANNFQMSETYFLSEDGQRLFVIIRIGDPKRPETMAGVNRVYDRISSSPLS
jgi:hypothetical protein